MSLFKRMFESAPSENPDIDPDAAKNFAKYGEVLKNNPENVALQLQIQLRARGIEVSTSELRSALGDAQFGSDEFNEKYHALLIAKGVLPKDK